MTAPGQLVGAGVSLPSLAPLEGWAPAPQQHPTPVLNTAQAQLQILLDQIQAATNALLLTAGQTAGAAAAQVRRAVEALLTSALATYQQYAQAVEGLLYGYLGAAYSIGQSVGVPFPQPGTISPGPRPDTGGLAVNVTVPHTVTQPWPRPTAELTQYLAGQGYPPPQPPPPLTFAVQPLSPAPVAPTPGRPSPALTPGPTPGVTLAPLGQAPAPPPPPGPVVPPAPPGASAGPPGATAGNGQAPGGPCVPLCPSPGPAPEAPAWWRQLLGLLATPLPSPVPPPTTAAAVPAGGPAAAVPPPGTAAGGSTATPPTAGGGAVAEPAPPGAAAVVPPIAGAAGAPGLPGAAAVLTTPPTAAPGVPATGLPPGTPEPDDGSGGVKGLGWTDEQKQAQARIDKGIKALAAQVKLAQVQAWALANNIQWPDWCDLDCAAQISTFIDSIKGATWFNDLVAMDVKDVAHWVHDALKAAGAIDLVAEIGGGAAGLLAIPGLWLRDLVILIGQSVTDNPLLKAVLSFLRAGMEWAQRLLAVDLSAEIRAIEYSLSSIAPNRLPSQGEVNRLAVTSRITNDQWLCLTRAMGNCPRHQALVRNDSQTFAGADVLTRLYHRGQLTQAQWRQALARLAWWQESEQNRMELASRDWPSTSTAMRWVDRQARNRGLAQGYGWDEEPFVGDLAWLAQWAAGNGVPPDQLQLAWRAHWSDPSWAQLLEMRDRLRPGRVPDGQELPPDELELWLRRAGYPSYWRQRILAVSRAPVSRRDLDRQYRRGVLSGADYQEGLRDLGLTEAQATRSYLAVRAELIKSALTSPPARRYLALGTTRRQALGELTTWGLDEAAAERVLGQLDAQAAADSRARCAASLERQYQRGGMTRAAFVSDLVQLGVELDRAEIAAQRADCERASKDRLASLAQLVAWRCAGYLTPLDFAQRVGRLNYHPDEVVIILRQTEARCRNLELTAQQRAQARATRAADTLSRRQTAAQKAAERAARAAAKAARAAQREREREQAKLTHLAQKWAKASSVPLTQAVERLHDALASLRLHTGDTGAGALEMLAVAVDALTATKGTDLERTIAELVYRPAEHASAESAGGAPAPTP